MIQSSQIVKVVFIDQSNKGIVMDVPIDTLNRQRGHLQLSRKFSIFDSSEEIADNYLVSNFRIGNNLIKIAHEPGISDDEKTRRLVEYILTDKRQY